MGCKPSSASLHVVSPHQGVYHTGTDPEKHTKRLSDANTDSGKLNVSEFKGDGDSPSAAVVIEVKDGKVSAEEGGAEDDEEEALRMLEDTLKGLVVSLLAKLIVLADRRAARDAAKKELAALRRANHTLEEEVDAMEDEARRLEQESKRAIDQLERLKARYREDVSGLSTLHANMTQEWEDYRSALFDMQQTLATAVDLQ